MTNLDKRKIIANIEIVIRKGRQEEFDSSATAETVFRSHMLPLIETYEMQLGNLRTKLKNSTHPKLGI